jgi:hypothetical protein
MREQNAAESWSAGILDIKLKPAVAQLRTIVPVERRNIADREALLHRIRGEFEEMQGMSLTLGQAARLFGVSPEAGTRILQGMVQAQVLDMTADHRYVLCVSK